MARKKIAQFISRYEEPTRKACVYADAEWGEYRVTFYLNGAKQEGADYHDSNKLGAFDAATVYAFPEMEGNPMQALHAWREHHGAQWKERLSVAWMRAAYPGMNDDQSAGLQRLRNTCGPSWLAQQPARVGDI